MTIHTKPITLTINEKAYGPIDVPEDTLMVDFLHEYLGLTGTRLSCGQGVCSACAIILDHDNGQSEEVKTCITGAHFFNGKKVRTVEGAATTDATGKEVLSPIQQAFLEHYSFQCGYCTPGFVNAATLLVERLQKKPILLAELEPAIEQALQNHICRCTGYVKYYEAVRDTILKMPGLIKDAA